MTWPALDYDRHCSLHRMAHATNLGMQGWGRDWVPYEPGVGAWGDDIAKILATPDKCGYWYGHSCSTARMIRDRVERTLAGTETE